jgi:hypothetical protein
MPYDPNSVNYPNGQKTPYIGSTVDALGTKIRPVTAIPHPITPDNNGTNYASFGDQPVITRIEGQGNGGNLIELSQASINEIMSGSPWKINHASYKAGFGPVTVKVIDPLKIKKGEFKIRFLVENEDIDSAQWVLENMNTNEKRFSDTLLAFHHERIIPELGISITIQNIKFSKYPNNINLSGIPLHPPLKAEIVYKSSQKWLGGLKDSDTNSTSNWIRSGTHEDNSNPNYNDYSIYDNWKQYWYDENEDFENLIDGTWAPFKLTSYTKCGPSFIYSANSGNELKNLASVDLIITNDQSKWTRCPVLEMCEDPALSQGHAEKLRLRKAHSVGKDENRDYEKAPDGSDKLGMGWFPGYAINIETGERLNIMFTEDSWLAGENGKDMIWNPTSNLTTSIGEELYGGKHIVYIMGHNSNDPKKLPCL